jgi:hypothetical protein
LVQSDRELSTKRGIKTLLDIAELHARDFTGISTAWLNSEY